MSKLNRNEQTVLVVLAFAAVYLIWGSTYFFIQKAIKTIPPFLMGGIRFMIAGILMASWCLLKGEGLWNWKQIRPSIISGLMLLLVGNGAVIWAEQVLPSSLVAVLVSSAPIWFVLLDKAKWKDNFSSKEVLTGLFIGFIGVALLFSEEIMHSFSSNAKGAATINIMSLVVLIIGAMSWAGGSLYSKYNATGNATVNTTWQMLAASIAFFIVSFFSKEWNRFNFNNVSNASWLALSYLIVFGSLIGYSAYVWLLKVRPAIQVSTYAYVNPVVAVLLGMFFNHETISWIQILGLVVIITSVLLINIGKYRKEKALKKNEGISMNTLVE